MSIQSNTSAVYRRCRQPQFVPPHEPTVKPGNYATAINIHNYYLKPTTLRKKAVIALPESVLPRGQISPIIGEDLEPTMRKQWTATKS